MHARRAARTRTAGAHQAGITVAASWRRIARILQNMKSCGLSAPRSHGFPSPTAAGAEPAPPPGGPPRILQPRECSCSGAKRGADAACRLACDAPAGSGSAMRHRRDPSRPPHADPICAQPGSIHKASCASGRTSRLVPAATLPPARERSLWPRHVSISLACVRMCP
jgi:hypothetical protein